MAPGLQPAAELLVKDHQQRGSVWRKNEGADREVTGVEAATGKRISVGLGQGEHPLAVFHLEGVRRAVGGQQFGQQGASIQERFSDPAGILPAPAILVATVCGL